MNSRRDFLLTVGALAGSHILQLFAYKPHLGINNENAELLGKLTNTWYENQTTTVKQYIFTNQIASKKDDELKRMIKTDFETENTISHDGFVFSLTEFAIAIIVLKN